MLEKIAFTFIAHRVRVSLAGIYLVALSGLAPIHAKDRTISSDLTVTGTMDVNGNTFTFGTQNTSPGLSLSYANADADTLTFYLNRNPGSFLWAHSSSIAAMRLTGNHELVIYKSDGSAAGLTFTPATSMISLGGATLYRDSSSGALRTNGAFTVDGSLGASNGTISGGAIGLTLNAGGSGNQNITLAPTGSGYTLVNGKVGLGTSAPAAQLHVSGDSTIKIGEYNTETFLYFNGKRTNTWNASFLAFADETKTGGRYSLGVRGSNDNSAAPWKLYYYGNSSQNMAFSVQPTALGADTYTQSFHDNTVFIDTAGKLGLGTTAPAATLHISGDATMKLGEYWYEAQFYLNGKRTGTWNASYVSFADENKTGGRYTLGVRGTNDSATAPWKLYYYGNSSQNMAISIQPSSLGADTYSQSFHDNAVFIDATGKLGLGTTAPTATLHISGDSTLKLGEFNYESQVYLNGKRTGTWNASYFVFSDENKPTGRYTFGVRGTNDSSVAPWKLHYYGAASQNLAIGIIPSSLDADTYAQSLHDGAIYITTTANVGVGTTSPTAKLAVNGDTHISGQIKAAGAVLIAPQGDLSMGSFISGPTPTF